MIGQVQALQGNFPILWRDSSPVCVTTGLLPWVKLIDNFDAEYEYVTNEGTVFTFKTNLDAPRYRLINVDFARPAPGQWKELIPQHDKDVLGERNKFSVLSLNKIQSRVLSVLASYVFETCFNLFTPQCLLHARTPASCVCVTSTT